MIIQYYSFNKIPNLFLVATELKRDYSDLIIDIDSELTVLTIQAKKSSLDENIHNLIKYRGGMLLKEKKI